MSCSAGSGTELRLAIWAMKSWGRVRAREGVMVESRLGGTLGVLWLWERRPESEAGAFRLRPVGAGGLDELRRS